MGEAGSGDEVHVGCSRGGGGGVGWGVQGARKWEVGGVCKGRESGRWAGCSRGRKWEVGGVCKGGGSGCARGEEVGGVQGGGVFTKVWVKVLCKTSSIIKSHRPFQDKSMRKK